MNIKNWERWLHILKAGRVRVGSSVSGFAAIACLSGLFCLPANATITSVTLSPAGGTFTKAAAPGSVTVSVVNDGSSISGSYHWDGPCLLLPLGSWNGPVTTLQATVLTCTAGTYTL